MKTEKELEIEVAQMIMSGLIALMIGHRLMGVEE